LFELLQKKSIVWINGLLKYKHWCIHDITGIAFSKLYLAKTRAWIYVCSFPHSFLDMAITVYIRVICEWIVTLSCIQFYQYVFGFWQNLYKPWSSLFIKTSINPESFIAFWSIEPLFILIFIEIKTVDENIKWVIDIFL